MGTEIKGFTTGGDGREELFDPYLAVQYMPTTTEMFMPEDYDP